MKRIVAFLLCISCIMLLISGCKQPPVDSPDTNTSGQTDPSTEPTSNETVGKTEATNNTEETVGNSEPVNIEDIEGPLAQYVQTAIKETLIFSGDQYGNKQSTPVRIPKLLPFSEDAIACQKEIQEKYDAMVADVRNSHADGYTSSTASIDYEAYLNGNVFSLVIHACSMFDLCSYRVYNFDIASGKRLSTEELMNQLQIPNHAEKFTKIAQDAFEADWGNNTTSEFKGEHLDLYNSQKAKNCSKENIDKAMPYVAEDGKVMVVINIYSLAGAEKYPRVFSLS